MPKENYEGIKAAASQDIPISSLRVAAPRRRRRRQHVAAVALSAADTRRRMGAGLLRHRSGTVRVPVRPQRQPVRDGSRQDATRDVRVGALAAGNRSPAQRGIAALVRNQTGRFPSVQSVDFYLDLAHGSVESAATLLLVEDARQDERQYVESVLTHQRQQLAHMYSQPRPSALDLGRVDVATEKFLEGGGLGAEMVRTERDVAAVQDYIEQSKLHATDGRSATEPFVDPLSSTATPSAFVSGLDGNPALHEMVDAILQDSPFTSEEAPAAPALTSEASHVGATSALKKTDAGTRCASSTTTPARKSSRQRSITRSHGSRRARRIRLVRSLAYRRPSPSRRCGVTSICTPLRPGIRGIITLSSLALKRQGRRIRTATFVAGRQTSKPAKQVLLHASTPARTHTCAHSSSKHLPLQACVCVRCKRARSDFFGVQKLI